MESGVMATQVSLSTKIMELLVSYYNRPSIRVRNQLVQLNMGLVRKVAHRIAHQCPEPYEDLEQIGCLGLIAAIERFDPTQGCAFSSFAVPYIRGEMLHFLRDRANTVKVPRRWQQLNKDAQKVRQMLSEDLGRQPSEQEIAEKLNVSIQEWQSVKLAAKNRVPLSLDATVYQQSDSTVTLGDTLLDINYLTMQHAEEERMELQQALNSLEAKTREMIESVFIKQHSRQEVAKRIGVSPITVTRRIQKGIEQLAS
jgi:RNA polymerase sigma-B factor